MNTTHPNILTAVLPRLLAAIAKRTMGFETLEPRSSDSLDFRDTYVGGAKNGLEMACYARDALAIAQGFQRGSVDCDAVEELDALTPHAGELGRLALRELKIYLEEN